MADLEIEKTMGIARKDLLTYMLLNRWYNAIESFENYNRNEYLGAEGDLSKVKVKLDSLLFTIKSAIKRSVNDVTFKKIMAYQSSDEIKVLIESFDLIADWLDTKKITMLDDKKYIDRTDIEANNYEDGKR